MPRDTTDDAQPVLIADGGRRGEEAPGNPDGRQRPRHPLGYLVERSDE